MPSARPRVIPEQPRQLGRNTTSNTAPAARPLSADIGEIVAGIAATAVRGDAAGDGLLEIPDAAALAQLRNDYQCDEIAPQPLLWNWEKEQRSAA